MSQLSKIFISHSWNDKPFVEKIKSYLESLGMTVWLDNYEIAGGESIIGEIEKGIYTSDFFSIILTPKAVSSVMVRRELHMALWRWVYKLGMQRSFILPLLKEDCQIWNSIEDLYYIDFRKDDLFAEKCDELKFAVLKPQSSELYEKQKLFIPSNEKVQAYKDALQSRSWESQLNYIPRPIIHERDYSSYSSLHLTKKVSPLADLLLKVPRILLSADAGMGKSVELRHLVADLCASSSILIPIFASLNKYIDQELDFYIPEINSFSDETKVIVLDGFDEVQAEYKNALTRRLELYAVQHPLCRIVVSSRTNLRQEISGFENYYLVPLDIDSSLAFANTKLGMDFKQFEKEIWQRDYGSLLTHPFYLFLLVEIFRISKQLPSSRAEVFEYFVQNQLQADMLKFRTVITNIERKKTAIRSEMERLALIIETLGRNYITDEELSEVISDGNMRELIVGLGTIKKRDGDRPIVQFEHNNFQEYLAAVVLARQEVEKIKSYVTFDPAKREFKPSWSNTTGFLLNIISEDQTKYNALVAWLNEIEPDVLVKAEKDRVPSAMRLDIFKRIFEKFASKRIHIPQPLYNIKDLGQFADSPQTINYLIEALSSRDDESVLSNAVELLRFMTPQPSQREQMRAQLLRFVDRRLGGHLVCSALLTLGDLHLSDTSTTAGIVSELGESDNSWMRFGLYYYLYTSDWLDDYVDIFLQGIQYIRMSTSFNQEVHDTRLGDESYHLQMGLRRVKSSKALKKLITYFIKDPEDIDRAHLTEDLPIIVHNIEIANGEEPGLFEMMAALFDRLVRLYQHEEVQILLHYFDATGTREKLFHYLFENRSRDNEWYSGVAVVLNEKSTEYIADAFLASTISEHDIWVLRNFIPMMKGRSSDWYLAIINQRTGNKFIPPQPRDYTAEHKARATEDFNLLFDREKFIGGIKKIYDTEGKERLSAEDLHEIRRMHWEDPYYSELVLHELGQILRSSPKSFQQVEEIILTNDWGFFGALRLVDRFAHGNEITLTDKQRNTLKKWYQENISKVDFRSVLGTTTNNRTRASTLAVTLWFITRRFNFDCPKGVLLDMLSFDWPDDLKMGGIGFIEQRVSTDEIAVRVMENLKKGIGNESVLENHLDFCERCRIEDVVPLCPSIVMDTTRSDNLRLKALEVLGSFEVGKLLFKELLTAIQGECGWAALERNKETDAVTVTSRLKQILSSADKNDRRRAAVLLTRMGNIDGLEALISIVDKDNQPPGDHNERELFNHVVTPEAIDPLIRLLELTYRPGFVDNAFYSFQSAILSTLRTITITFNQLRDVSEKITAMVERLGGVNGLARYLYAFLAELEHEVRLNKSFTNNIKSAIQSADGLLDKSS